MTTPNPAQSVIDQASSVLGQAGDLLVAVESALPALLAAGSGGSESPIDTTALVTQVTAVINATNAIVALLPAGTVPAPSTPAPSTPADAHPGAPVPDVPWKA